MESSAYYCFQLTATKPFKHDNSDYSYNWCFLVGEHENYDVKFVSHKKSSYLLSWPDIFRTKEKQCMSNARIKLFECHDNSGQEMQSDYLLSQPLDLQNHGDSPPWEREVKISDEIIIRIVCMKPSGECKINFQRFGYQKITYLFKYPDLNIKTWLGRRLSTFPCLYYAKGRNHYLLSEQENYSDEAREVELSYIKDDVPHESNFVIKIMSFDESNNEINEVWTSEEVVFFQNSMSRYNFEKKILNKELATIESVQEDDNPLFFSYDTLCAKFCIRQYALQIEKIGEKLQITELNGEGKFKELYDSINGVNKIKHFKPEILNKGTVCKLLMGIGEKFNKKNIEDLKADYEDNEKKINYSLLYIVVKSNINEDITNIIYDLSSLPLSILFIDADQNEFDYLTIHESTTASTSTSDCNITKVKWNANSHAFYDELTSKIESQIQKYAYNLYQLSH